jgi:hypothetical protein
VIVTPNALITDIVRAVVDGGVAIRHNRDIGDRLERTVTVLIPSDLDPPLAMGVKNMTELSDS